MKRDDRRKAGLCLDCHDPVSPGRTRCEKHLVRSAAATNRYLETDLGRATRARLYSMDNVVSCCAVCNLARGDRFTVEEMIEFIGPAIRTVKLKRGVLMTARGVVG